jgi:hypothetical protein
MSRPPRSSTAPQREDLALSAPQREDLALSAPVQPAFNTLRTMSREGPGALRSLRKATGTPTPDGARSRTTLCRSASFNASRKPDHEQFSFIP